MWVVSVSTLLRESDLPADVAALGLFEQGSVVNTGGSVMVHPPSAIVAGPAFDGETIRSAEAELAETLHAKRLFDVVGHSGRGDLFWLTLRGVEIALPVGDSSPMTPLSDQVWRVPHPQGDAALPQPADEGERDR